MVFNRRWLFAVLVSAFQLIAMLVGVVWLFAWFEAESNEKTKRAIGTTNAALAKNIAFQIRELQLTDTTSPQARQKLGKLCSGSFVPNDGFVFAFAKEGTLLSDPSVFPMPAEQLKLELQDLVGRKPGTYERQLPFGLYLIYLWPNESSEVFVAVAQRPAIDMALNEVGVNIARQLGFAATLALGLIATTLSLVILSRYENDIETRKQSLECEVQDRTKELTKTKNAIIFGLAKLAESRDNDTGDHLDRIRKYVQILANDLARSTSEIDAAFIHDIGLASSLHDIGKVGIPDSILLKQGRLTPEERKIMEMHAEIGGECLEAIESRLGQNDFMEMARKVAYWHHERWDGTGYPHGLAEEAIPLVARIVAVADVYDALTSRRPYKEAMSHEKSRSIILSGSGSQFDPEIVDAFLRHEDKFAAIAAEQKHLSADELTSELGKRMEMLNQLTRAVEESGTVC